MQFGLECALVELPRVRPDKIAASTTIELILISWTCRDVQQLLSRMQKCQMTALSSGIF